MTDLLREDLTQLLHGWGAGDQGAFQELIPVVYPELRGMAAGYVGRERPGTIQATALVHDLYLRLVTQKRANFPNRRAFFAFAATVMRHILIDQARARQSARRGHGLRVALDDEPTPAQVAGADAGDGIDLLDLDRALHELAGIDPRKAELVQLCAFLGCSRAEAADLLGVSLRTAKRDFRMARAWLGQRMGLALTPDATAES